jgi:uncharacterized protein (TIGR03382 family)
MNLPKKISENLPGYAALAVLLLLAVAMVRRRFRWGYVLLHLAVALGERWQDARVKARLGAALAALPDDDLQEPRHPRDLREFGA